MTIFIPPEIVALKHNVKVPPGKSRYLLTVLRCKKGRPLTVIDGKGKAYSAQIVSVAKKDVLIDIIGEVGMNTELPVKLTLCQGILKGDKMDMVIQKATELGVSEIVPLITERCVVKETRKVTRWHTIAEEAAEQCDRAVIPMITKPVVLMDMLAGEHLNGLFFRERGGRTFSEAMAAVNNGQPIHIFIGPEGGFTEGEASKAEGRGIIGTTIGKRILRADTAAIAASALVQFSLENKCSTG